jgi:hypothetical protein
MTQKHICNGSYAIGEKNPAWKHSQKEVPKWFPRLTRWEKVL